MTTSISPSAALAVIEPAFSEPEKLALAGFLAGYSCQTREAYPLDLRQFSTWCRQRQLRLFAARRADIELFARDLEAAGRSRATITRRLSTIAGLYKYAVEERPARTLPGCPRPTVQDRLRVPCDRPGPQRSRRPPRGGRARHRGRARPDLAARP
jgi:hypothetical protein